MLKPIPSRMLSDSCTVKVPTQSDAWQSVTYEDVSIRCVHLQAENTVTKTKDNTEVVLTGTLFVDGRLSRPSVDLDALARQAEAVGYPLRVDCRGNSYDVVTVDDVPDDTGKLHHYELGLV